MQDFVFVCVDMVQCVLCYLDLVYLCGGMFGCDGNQYVQCYVMCYDDCWVVQIGQEIVYLCFQCCEFFVFGGVVILCDVVIGEKLWVICVQYGFGCVGEIVDIDFVQVGVLKKGFWFKDDVCCCYCLFCWIVELCYLCR